ncbi:hypothetical protein [Chromobacterium violaceum]|uniref:hypothetical protein n=1 Tax=Chromobacterium violaceum TaxID=536 RepID=UPI001CE1A82B|nr:hypothetical protein [Chromobacterium violaceum]
MINFIFGYLGIPQNIYDATIKSITSKNNNSFETRGISLKDGEIKIERSHCEKLLAKISESIYKKEPSSQKSKIGVAIIYVDKKGERNEVIYDYFFPSTLIAKVTWSPCHGNKAEVNQSKNTLAKLLLDTSNCTRHALLTLHKEVTECANRTPLLLPYRNFHSKKFHNFLEEVQNELSTAPSNSSHENLVKILKKEINSFESYHPMQAPTGRGKKKYYADEKGIEFKSPGSTPHGLLRSQDEKHDTTCFMNGYRRLGAPYNPAFHYDCTKQGSILDGHLYYCHGNDKRPVRGDPHVNIAPNDNFRI